MSEKPEPNPASLAGGEQSGAKFAAALKNCYLSNVEVDSATSVIILPVAEKVPAVGS